MAEKYLYTEDLFDLFYNLAGKTPNLEIRGASSESNGNVCTKYIKQWLESEVE